MKSLGTSYSFATPPMASATFSAAFCSPPSLSLPRGMAGREGWILNNTNSSHLHHYYALLGGLRFINFLFFVYLSRAYVYKAEVYEQQVEASTEVHHRAA
ncbi:hypothetical protein BHM03_00010090 [Ensete ventricosum]|nr:hypothetical protein BHM03_00010090 [Ensete ventricosum]